MSEKKKYYSDEFDTYLKNVIETAMASLGDDAKYVSFAHLDGKEEE